MFKALLNFSVGIFVARYLGPDRFGVLNYAMGLVLFFSIFSALGLDNILVRELVEKGKEERNCLMGSAMALRVCGSVLAMILTCSLLYLTHADSETWILTGICTLSFVFMPAETFRGYYEATVNGKTIVYVEAIQCLISTGLRIYFIAVEGSVFWFAVCWLSEWIFTGLGFALFYRLKDGHFSDWRIQWGVLKHLFKESLPLLVSAMAIVVYQQIDKIMLKNMLLEGGNEEVGYYSVALRIIPFVVLIPQMIGKALVPSLVNARKHNPQVYTERSQLFLDLMTWIGIALSVILFISASPVMALYGNDYKNATEILRIVAWKGLFISMSVSSGIWIVTEGIQKWAVLRNLSGCLVNVALNWLWIPVHGAVGSAWATLISFAIASYLTHLMIPIYRPVFVMQTKALLSGPLRLLLVVKYQIISHIEKKKI